MVFYALYNETSHEEILGLGSSETVQKGTKKYAAPVFFWSFLPLLKSLLHMHYLIFDING